MAHCKLTADHGDEIPKVGSMTYVGQQRLVLLVNCLPIRAMHLRVVEVLTLDPPGFTVDLRPFSTWINLHFQLGNVERTITNFRRTLSCNNSPTIRAITCLVQQFLLVCR